MRNLGAWGLALFLPALLSMGLAQEPPHVLVLPDHGTWGPASPKLPPGAQFAELVGDPSKHGEPYVFRAKLPDGYSVPPHWHPMDENVTVIQGVLRLGFGERIDRAAMRELPPGSYTMLPKEMPHYNEMKGETILQFHGIGPYDIAYVNPAHDPRRSRPGSHRWFAAISAQTVE
ncbi:MAG: cupin domain-containing protein [Vicinamibacteria bacterium]